MCIYIYSYIYVEYSWTIYFFLAMGSIVNMIKCEFSWDFRASRWDVDVSGWLWKRDNENKPSNF